MKNIILVFKNSNSRGYWFDYIAECLNKNIMGIKKHSYNYEIEILDKIKICCITEANVDKFLIGRHDYKVFTDLETRLEKHPKKMLGEILNG